MCVAAKGWLHGDCIQIYSQDTLQKTLAIKDGFFLLSFYYFINFE